MRFRHFILFAFNVFCGVCVFAQNKTDLTQSRILVLLDGSSSMIHKWADGKEKFKVAGEIIGRIMDSVYAVNDQVEFSLRVFGHQHTVEENYCFDTKNEVPFAKDNRLQMALRLAALQPLGVTPIAYALQQAAENDLIDEAHNAYSIILITDGGESCGGDICDVIKTLILNKVYFKPYILSLENDPQLKTTYACMGDYLQVTKHEDIARAVGIIVNAFRPVLKITTLDYKRLQTEVTRTHAFDTGDLQNPVKTWKADSLVTLRPAPLKVTGMLPSLLQRVTLPTIEFGPLSASAPLVSELPSLITEPRVPTKIETLLPHGHSLLAMAAPVVPDIDYEATVPGLPGIAKEAPVPAVVTKMALRKPVALQLAVAPELILVPYLPDALLPPLSKEAPVCAAIDRMLIRKLIPMALEKAPELPFSTVTSSGELPSPSMEVPAPVKTPVTYLAIRKPVTLKVEPTEPMIISAGETASLPPVAAEKPGPLKVTGLALRTISRILIEPGAMSEITYVAPDFTTPTVVKEAAPIPRIPKFAIANAANLKMVSIDESHLPVPDNNTPETELPAPAKEITRSSLTVAPMKPGSFRKFYGSFVLDEKYNTRPLPPLPPLKKEEFAKGPKTKPDITEIPSIPPEKRAEIHTETEDAKETTLEVYFTNGKGKFYPSTPQVVLIDPKTNTDVKKFYRTIDADGNPDPQTDITPGIYNVTFSVKRTLVAPNVNIEKNKRNKVYITVKNTNLSFIYANALNRPLTEFTAVVTERNKNMGRVQKQKCTEKLEYEPGNYHIEINTFPPDVRNVDLDFDLETAITVLQPGFVKFDNAIKAASVKLFERYGDKFVQFYTLDLNDPRSSHLQIQPGEYQAHYSKGPVKSFSAEQVVSFTVRSTEETIVEIK